jgi:hypothetical protein
MDHDVIPFIPANFVSFVGLVFTFGILGIVIHLVLFYQARCWQLVRDLAGQMLWDEKIRGPCIGMLRFTRDFLFGQPTTQGDEELPSGWQNE